MGIGDLPGAFLSCQKARLSALLEQCGESLRAEKAAAIMPCWLATVFREPVKLGR
jgi:hypothetical protein